ncbi:MAG: signal peptidase I [Clostridia bacterium]|nr:signal peptidase I [Clostridia bacterium]
MRRIEEFWVEFSSAEEDDAGPASRFHESLYDALDSLKGAVIAVFLVFALMFRVVGVEGDSMNPTLNSGDWLAVSGAETEFERGDIVVVTQPWVRNVPIIKRVIAVGGDTVDIDFYTHEVFVNGELLDEPYIAEPTELRYDVDFPLTVDEGKLFVMGDNRNDSVDSRSSAIGLIDERYVLGRALVRLLPSFDWNIG